MSDAYFTGRWTGIYSYGEDYSDAHMDLPVRFVIEMTVQDGIVKGTCIDQDDYAGPDNPASIEGFIENNFISFIKRYSCFWQRDEDGNPILFPDIPSHEVHYSGYFNDGVFSGEWEISIPFISESGLSTEFYSSGTWSMDQA